MQKWQQWETASEADWGIAVERETVLRLLAERAQLSTSDVDEATIRLGISRGVFYKLLRRYEQRPQTSSLLPSKRGRDNSLTFLNPTREMPASEQKSATKANQPPPKKRKRRKDHNIPQFDLHRELQRISGVDLTRIDGIDVMTGLTVISEVGLDMSRWPSEQHFASWLGLCPSNELSGGKILKKRTRKVVNRAATAFRIAASTLRASQSYLGSKFRRLRSRLGPPKAITAMARTLAILFYRMLKFGQTTWIVEPSSTSNGNETSSFNIYRERRHNSASNSWL